MAVISGNAISGVETLAVTETQLPDNTVTIKSGNYYLQAHPDNADTIYLGGQGVTAANGFPMEAGLGIQVNVPDLSVYYAIADVAGDKITWLKLCGAG